MKKSIGGLYLCILGLLPLQSVNAQVNGVGARPYMGWSSWSQQSHQGNAWLTESQIKTQSDALKATGLQDHGYTYINLDADWNNGFDAYGRPTADLTEFPDGMAATADYIHQNGQKAGIYWVPGVPLAVVAANSPILGTPYHARDIIVSLWNAGNSFLSSYKIDFSKPGAQEYVNSIVDLFASWGYDFIKIDGVTPGSYRARGATGCPQNTCIDNTQDIKAWSLAIQQSGHPIWLELSNTLDHDYVGWWEQWSNGRRIEGDIESYASRTSTTTWATVVSRFTDLVAWQNDAGPSLGWNDLDSLEVGNNTNTNGTLVDGLTNDERQTTMTLWSIANAPLYLGDNLTQLDSYGLQLLTNDEVIAVDQSGHPAKQVTAGGDGNTPVWAAKLDDGTYYVALFNLNSAAASASISWNQLGFSGSAQVRDLWMHQSLESLTDAYTVALPAHGSALLRVSPTP